MIKKCTSWDCKEEAKYCSKHFKKEYNESYNRGFVIWILCFFFVGIIFSMPAVILGNVDEAEFCLNKLNKYFPEYNFESAGYCGDVCEDSNRCVGYYQENINGETRDGLNDVTEKGATLKRVYKLTNQKDINYLARDDLSNLLAGFGIFFLAAGCFVLFMYLKEGKI